jgi:hypothetical protein
MNPLYYGGMVFRLPPRKDRSGLPWRGRGTAHEYASRVRRSAGLIFRIGPKKAPDLDGW